MIWTGLPFWRMSTEITNPDLGALTTNAPVSVTVRLFGTARQAAGVAELKIETPTRCTVDELARSLRRSLPGLVGAALDERSGTLKPSHTFNLNGVEFIEGSVKLRNGDQILLFSSQAGG